MASDPQGPRYGHLKFSKFGRTIIFQRPIARQVSMTKGCMRYQTIAISQANLNQVSKPKKKIPFWGFPWISSNTGNKLFAVFVSACQKNEVINGPTNFVTILVIKIVSFYECTSSWEIKKWVKTNLSHLDFQKCISELIFAFFAVFCQFNCLLFPGSLKVPHLVPLHHIYT